MKKNRGLIVAATFIAFSIYIFVASSTITSTSGAALGPAFMPRVIALSLFVLGILNFLEEWKARKALLKEEPQPSCEEPQPVVTDKKEKLRAFIAKYIDYISGVLILLYAFSVKPLGFLLASCLYMLIHMLLLTVNQKRNYIILALLTVLVPTGVYFLFVKVFYLMLPSGILG